MADNSSRDRDPNFDFDAVFNADAPSFYEAAAVMADPSHPGDLMRDIMGAWNVTVTDAAKATGLQRTHLSAMLSGDKPVSIESAIKFEAAFGGPAPIVIHGMSDLYESAKALKRRDELVGGIVRMSEAAVATLKETKARKRIKEAA